MKLFIALVIIRRLHGMGANLVKFIKFVLYNVNIILDFNKCPWKKSNNLVNITNCFLKNSDQILSLEYDRSNRKYWKCLWTGKHVIYLTKFILFLAVPSKLQKASLFLLNFIKNVLVAFMELDYLEQCAIITFFAQIFQSGISHARSQHCCCHGMIGMRIYKYQCCYF